MGDEQAWSRLKAAIYSFVYRNPKSNRLLVDHAALAPEDSVLDIGCGPGAAVRSAASVVTAGLAAGVDRSPAMIDIARKRSAELDNVSFEVGSAEALPFDDDTFTVVWTVHAFHHWENREQGLSEAHRVLAPGGRLLILEIKSTGEHGLSLDGALDVQFNLDALGFTDTAVELLGKDYLVGGVAGG